MVNFNNYFINIFLAYSFQIVTIKFQQKKAKQKNSPTKFKKKKKSYKNKYNKKKQKQVHQKKRMKNLQTEDEQNNIFQQQNTIQQDQPQQQYQSFHLQQKTKIKSSNPQLIQFNKAKRTLIKMINSYFLLLKYQLMHGNGKFIYNRSNIPVIQSALTKLATIRYTNLNTLLPKKSQLVDDFLLSYLSQSKKIIKYNLNIHNNNNQKPRQLSLQSQQNYQLPDTATPAAFGANAYFFDGSKFDMKRMVYIPIPFNYKINLITGHISLLSQQPKFYRMKSCIIKIKKGFMIIGGYVGQDKIITKQCTIYSIQNQSFHPINSLNLFHSCPSGCLHNQKIYIFSSQGIQYYSQNIWTEITLPTRLKNLPYQYCHSISSTQIMILGGKFCNKNSQDIKLYNTQTKQIDQYSDILPIGISNQRSWGPMIINHFVTIMSNVQASLLPQVTVKRNLVQLVLVGFGGCYLQTLVQTT